MSLLFKLFGIGYDNEGFDKYGYDKNGYNRLGYNEHGFNNSGFDSNGYNKKGYSKSGFNKLGYNNHGYDRWGYSKYGYDKCGFDKHGYDFEGYDNDGFNIHGYNKDGYNINGFNKFGFNKDGFDKEGYSYGGFDHLGYNREGFGRDGYNIDGYDKSGLGKNGFDKYGFDKRGYNKYGYDSEGYDDKGFDKYGYDKEAFNREGFDKYGFNKDGFNKNGLDKHGKHFLNLNVGQVVYHAIYEAGIVNGFNYNSDYVIISFDSIGDKTFRYSPSILKYISVELPEKLEKRYELKREGLYQKYDELERIHFDSILETIETLYNGTKDNYISSRSGFNDFSDSYNSETFANYQSAYSTYNSYAKLKNKPYFARVDYIERKDLYIGKNKISNKVIDWADPICSIYYNYQIYLGNEKFKLSLVRNFDIVNGVYFGYDDLYNQFILNSNDGNKNSFVIDDPLLMKIIKSNRESKRITDIISSIQSNQYNIITSNSQNKLAVFGCAGSGKTMVLFHRIRYILRNESSIDPKKVYIVSPTGLLINESKDLIADLKLKSVNKFSTVKFYNNIMFKYYSELNKITIEKFNYTDNNSSLPSDFIRTIYSEDNLRKLYDQVISIFNTKKNKDKYIHSEKSRLIMKLNKLLGEDYTSLDKSIIHKHEAYLIRDISLGSYEELRNVSSHNLRKMKEHMQHQKNNKTARIKIIDYLISNNSASGQTKLTDKGDIYTSENCLPKTFKLFKIAKFGNINTKDMINNSWFKNPSKFYEEFDSLLDCTYRLFAFENGIENNYEFYVIESVLSEIKDNNNIPKSLTFEFELFVHLYLCSRIMGLTSNSDDILFVDEFQEYSASELNLIENLFPNASINLFGDINQNTNIKGINDLISIENFLKSYDTFEINQNYRNALEITEYVNREFGMNMMPIGLNGSLIEKIYTFDCFEMPKDNDRVALIVKEHHLIPEEILQSTDFILLGNSQIELSKDKINVLTIPQVKGLEFERVYVLREEMSRNEEYVAFTRALNELVILTLQ